MFVVYVGSYGLGKWMFICLSVLIEIIDVMFGCDLYCVGFVIMYCCWVG